jgi:dephospho-CoA kinase
MLKVGITGGIGSGKSMVCKIFQLLGIPVFYADEVAKSLYDTNEELKYEIIKHFGPETYQEKEDKHLYFNKGKMREIIFGDKNKLQLLNSIVHPYVGLEVEKFMSSQTSEYAIKEAALLVESSSYKQLDEIILVISPMELKLKRIALRDATNTDQIHNIMSKQMSDDQKREYADHIIYNDNQHLLISQVINLHQHLLNQSRKNKCQ